MPSFSVNESLFVIDMDDTSESILSIGETFADGVKIGVDRDRGEEFVFYVSEDGRYDILAAAPQLAERWVREGYLEKRMLSPHFTEDGDIDCYVLFSPSSHILLRITEARAHGSPYYAHMVASAIYRSRIIDPEVNLRDGILCELYGVVLPTYTRTPKVADAALFYNTLRGQFAPEDIRSPSDFTNGNGGLNRVSYNEIAKQNNLPVDTIEPYFQVGEAVDDFVQIGSHCLITGPLALTSQYQIFSTDRDLVLLAMNQAWSDELIERNLLLQMDIKQVQVGREVIRILALPRRMALEPLNDRHFGMLQSDTFDLALAIQRSRRRMPEAKFSNSLYVQALGLLLPVEFTGGTQEQDLDLIKAVVSYGPFAQGPFLDDVVDSCMAIVKA